MIYIRYRGARNYGLRIMEITGFLSYGLRIASYGIKIFGYVLKTQKSPKNRPKIKKKKCKIFPKVYFTVCFIIQLELELILVFSKH